MTQIQTIETHTNRLAPAILDGMAAVMCAGARTAQALRTSNALTLAAALRNGVTDPGELLDAAAADTTLTFGAAPTKFGVVAFTPNLMVVGFEALTLGTGAILDPFWGLWPWGLSPDLDNGMRESWANGVLALLNRRYEQAVQFLQSAAHRGQYVPYREQYLVRRALASNVVLAVNGGRCAAAGA